MAKCLLNAHLVLLIFGLLLLYSSPTRSEAELHDEEEETSSCQGAFDLYFVLDK